MTSKWHTTAAKPDLCKFTSQAAWEKTHMKPHELIRGRREMFRGGVYRGRDVNKDGVGYV